MSPAAFLVSGGSSGIGATIAAELLARGHRVGIISRQDAPEGPRAGPSGGGKLDWIRADLRQAESLEAAVVDWLARVSHAVDGLVMSAVDYGDGARHTVGTSNLTEFDRMLAVNLRAQFVLLSTLLPTLLARPRGLIVSVSSAAAVTAAPGRASYAASKAGSLALLRGLADELRDTGVAVVQVMPRNQVVTPGLRARRPYDFVFDGYDDPRIFRPLTSHLAATLGANLNGRLLAVDGLGNWEQVPFLSEPAGAAEPEGGAGCWS